MATFIEWGVQMDDVSIPCDSRQEAHQRKAEILADGKDYTFVEVYREYSVARDEITSVNGE